MIKTGYIEITDKARFVYHELEKPDTNELKFWFPSWYYRTDMFNKAMQKYEASKRTVKVSNIVEKCTDCHYELNNKIEYFKDGQKCKAKVNGKAEIIEIL